MRLGAAGLVALIACAPDAARDADELPQAPTRACTQPPEGALAAVAGEPRYALVGEPVVLDASCSPGAVSYQWTFGNGEGWEAPRAEPLATVTYAAPGRYSAVVEVRSAEGAARTAVVAVSVTAPAVFTPLASGDIVRLPDGRFAAVNEDGGELTVVSLNGDAWEVDARVPTCERPSSVSGWEDAVVVACPRSDEVWRIPLSAPTQPEVITLSYGSHPHAVLGVGASLYVSAQSRGALLHVTRSAPATFTVASIADVPDARALATLPGGRLAVTRWRSSPTHAEIYVVDLANGARQLWTLAFDSQPSSDTTMGGVPTLLDGLAVSADGRWLVVPSLQANLGQGVHRDGAPLTFETTVRAVISHVDATTGVEAFTRRKQLDNRGRANAVALTSRGDYAFVVSTGARSVERLDELADAQSGSILMAGFAPTGAALTADDRFLVVNAQLSRELIVYEVGRGFASLPAPVARLATVTSEPLSPALLLGARLFNDAFDGRLSKDQYIACAHCHPGGRSDGLTWDFTDRGEGLRNTISLLGRAGTGDGPLHWSANFDEVHDFENDIRGSFGGRGLMSEADFLSGTRAQTLGDAKAGVSPALDALAAYVSSLDTELRSPFRQADGSLSAAAARGKLLFESPATRCTECHSGPRLTDSRFVAPGQPLLHDVGTLGPGSGQRLGGVLTGLDTPTLHGLWDSAPYLHDGSAATLLDVLTTHNPGDTHGVTSALDGAALSDLVAYLLSLDGESG